MATNEEKKVRTSRKAKNDAAEVSEANTVEGKAPRKPRTSKAVKAEEKPESVYNVLSKIDVSAHIETTKKSKDEKALRYLPWVWAYDAVKSRYPDMTFRTIKFDENGIESDDGKGMPYQPLFKTSKTVTKLTPNSNGAKKMFAYLTGEAGMSEADANNAVARMLSIVEIESTKREIIGYQVVTEVTINGETQRMWLPVLDVYNNTIIDKPYVKNTKYGKYYVQPLDSMVLNTSIMRCLTKNFGMFGLGLYIYGGEDTPLGNIDPITGEVIKSADAKKEPEEKKEPAPVEETPADKPAEEPKTEEVKAEEPVEEPKVEEPVAEPQAEPVAEVVEEPVEEDNALHATLESMSEEEKQQFATEEDIPLPEEHEPEELPDVEHAEEIPVAEAPVEQPVENTETIDLRNYVLKSGNHAGEKLWDVASKGKNDAQKRQIIVNWLENVAANRSNPDRKAARAMLDLVNTRQASH